MRASALRASVVSFLFLLAACAEPPAAPPVTAAGSALFVNSSFETGNISSWTPVVVQMAAFATGVPPHIYEFHLYLRNSAILSDTQAQQFQTHFLG